LRLPVYSLRTGILTQLIFLIIAAMLLINVVMVKFSERNLIQAKVETAKLLIHALEQHLQDRFDPGEKATVDITSDPQFKRNIKQLLTVGGFPETMILDGRKRPVFTKGSSVRFKEQGRRLARQAMDAKKVSIQYSGMTWGVIWLSHEEVSVSSPLSIGGQTIGGITLKAPLSPIYEVLRRSEKFILLYVLLDALILAIVGIYLLSRIVVKPIHRLLKLTAGYKEGDLIPSIAESSRDEIGRLTRSMNIMLKRLDENKRELKDHISSLEKANRDLQQAQNEIIRSEKLASVGRLAAGIAHEIGNPIGIILGYLELINKNESTEDEKKDFLNRIQSEITRVNQTIRQLLDFSRPSNGEPEETHIHELIKNTVNILTPQPVMGAIRIDYQLEATSDEIIADPNQLQQVFLNVILNAADSLAGKENAEAKDLGKVLTILSVDAGDAMELRFEDNGSGLSEEELAQMFDPFYTTKDPGEGTGLGLSVCYRIVEGLGGTIRAEGVKGQGTTIIITLPQNGKAGHQRTHVG
jgi:two-component system NtrC family sensor kinase